MGVISVKYLLTLVLATIVCLPLLAMERDRSSVRCDGGHIRHGMDKYQVISRCGDPRAQETISGDDQPKVDKLVYKFKRSPSAPLIIFTFRGGKLINIKESR
ncbi:DUF2845 domain-containing protein [Thalassotalea euphylliae]|uniref:DUF2845 domain-containing protein n=1 Tax=Thalassotalea euphylliae TaxID=1655234 RepID=A0A3E0U3X5_9GAMM|nr:DUF2845 domain-containing protein [Thalassotalea euphylliae]REL30895.1 DUF2845 domain-containing protein [Thalassotalea euphylliae]